MLMASLDKCAEIVSSMKASGSVEQDIKQLQAFLVRACDLLPLTQAG